MLINWIFFALVCTRLGSAQLLNISCMNLPENQCHQSSFKTAENACEGWICWESQLTLANKRIIRTTFNNYRNSVAQNISNMNTLVWHWTLEQEAIRASFTCERKYLELYDKPRDIPGLGYSLVCENGCMYTENMVLPSQNMFKQLLYSFLKENLIQEYDLQSKMETIYSSNAAAKSQCSENGVRGADPLYPNLCTDLNLRSLYICEPENPCPGEDRTEVWRSAFEARVSRISLFETSAGPLLFINESITTVYREDDGTTTATTAIRTYIDTEGDFGKVLQYYPPVPRSLYYYPEEKAALFNETLHTLLGPDVSFIYLADPERCEVVTPTAATEGSSDAVCCFYLVLGTILTTLLLGALFVYTVNDYRKKIQ